MFVRSIVYRALSDADFFNINKPRGSEQKGGGQSYIDFPIRNISIADWNSFFIGIKGLSTQNGKIGPVWELPVKSLGLHSSANTQKVKIYQRRQQSISIASQKLDSSRSNRILAWHPDNNFPYPMDNSNRNQCPDGLVVYLISTFTNDVYAGWYLVQKKHNSNSSLKTLLNDINKGDSGIEFFEQEEIILDDSIWCSPFDQDISLSKEDDLVTKKLKNIASSKNKNYAKYYINNLRLINETDIFNVKSSIRKEQSLLRTILFGDSSSKECAICHKILPSNLLVAAHIKPRSKCSNEERVDENIVMPVCKIGCDDLFEKGYILIDDNGYISKNESIISTEMLDKILIKFKGKKCTFHKKETKRYFQEKNEILKKQGIISD